MSHRISFTNANDAFKYLYDLIMDVGDDRDGTKAMYNVGFYLLRPKANNILAPFRKFNLDYAEAEWQWYLSGDRSIKKLGELNNGRIPNIWNLMADENGNVNSNYGWQWNRNQQLHKVMEILREDPLSRKAVVSIYDGKEIDTYSKDTPCTGTIHFQIVNGALDMTVNMRSNDLIFGFCIDQYCFSKLQMMVAEKLEVEVGLYYHFASNMHIYERHYKMKEKFASKNDVSKIVDLKHED